MNQMIFAVVGGWIVGGAAVWFGLIFFYARGRRRRAERRLAEWDALVADLERRCPE